MTINTYCDISKPFYFDTEATPNWLLNNDRSLLADIVVHNETHVRLCN